MKLNGKDIVVRDNIRGSMVVFDKAPEDEIQKVMATESQYNDIVQVVMANDELLKMAIWLLEMCASGNYGGYFYLRGKLSGLEIGLPPVGTTDF